MSFLQKIFSKKKADTINMKMVSVDTDISDFNMFMDSGSDRQDTDLNEMNDHLKFISGGASGLKRRL